MPICNECNQVVEEKDIRYNKKWENWICRNCFVSELLYNAQNNKAQAGLLASNPMAMGAATKAANTLFDKMMPKKEK